MDDTMSEGVIQIPVDFATNLKCIVCNGYLSVPPIVSGNNGKNVCGRCDFITYNKQERRNIIYEDVAKLMSFPCIFEKCNKRIPWGEVEKHEKVCSYATILCPKKDCHEVVLVRELVTHFTWQHKSEKASSYGVNNVDIDHSVLESPQLLICREKPFLLFAYKSNTFIGISVYSLDPFEDENIKYFVTLTSNNGLLSKGRQKILPFNSRVHCADCFENKCNKKHHKYSLHYKNNSNQELHNSMTTKFEIDSVKRILEAEKVMFKVTLCDSSYPPSKKRKTGPCATPNSECDICKTLLSLPLVSHKSGSSLLECIKDKIKTCPCNSDIKDILGDFDVIDIMDDIKEEEDPEVAGDKPADSNEKEDAGLDISVAEVTPAPVAAGAAEPAKEP
uniref:RING-type E3 ubiquitin transferase n=1 Tax=Anoplophora glabripennis TaxID=217634 RepID=V5GX79_ANOGL